MRLYHGLDLARVRDWTCHGVLEAWRGAWLVRTLRTWRPERDDFADALADVAAFCARHEADHAVAVDVRGVGREALPGALRGPLARAADVYPILPSFSARPHRQRPDMLTWVGKMPLVSGLLRAVESGTLRFADGVRERDAFGDELRCLRLRPSRAGLTETWGTADQAKSSHDDRVMAVAYALWLGEALTREPGTIRPANRRDAT